jgi:oxygen-independent coproporphyrinogen-3 oxidase
MPPATVAAVLEAAERHWSFAPDIEITLEANPSSVEAARFVDLAAAGVNRVSLGIQALDDRELHFLGRAHGAAEGLAALDTAQRNFGRVSFDLIYALPDQGLADWQKTLDRALRFGTGHLSLYQLTIEPGTRFAAMAARGELQPTDTDHAAELFELTQDVTQAAGLPAYEISNHARPGEESRHNLTYWRYRDYMGVGPGAHGRRAGIATARARKPENWLARIDSNRQGIETEEPLTPQTQAREALVMGLRLAEGLERARVDHAIDQAAVDRLAALGLMERTIDRVRVTPAGMLLLDAILAEVAL